MRNLKLSAIVLTMMIANLAPIAVKAGNISIINAVGNRLIFALNVTQDSHCDMFYTLQYNETNFAFLSNVQSFNFVSYQRGKLVVQADNQIISFGAGEEGEGSTYIGYGLARHYAVAGFDIERVNEGRPLGLMINPDLKKVKTTTGQEIVCNSGGPGATQCAVSSDNPVTGVGCETSCGTGFYACCDDNVTTCGCVQASEIGQANNVCTIDYYSFP
jgi:hypothetical protein